MAEPVLHGIALVYKMSETITTISGSGQSSDWHGKSDLEKYRGDDGAYNATSTTGICEEFTWTGFPIVGTTPPVRGSMLTVADPVGNRSFITGSNWIVEDASWKAVNKGPHQLVVKLWRTPAVTS